uniref:Uncharacterized protein n=1 Tax=Anguilla anguilla TaxID=7936 RepID=A0A0E9TFE9_ANGAN
MGISVLKRHSFSECSGLYI